MMLCPYTRPRTGVHVLHYGWLTWGEDFSWRVGPRTVVGKERSVGHTAQENKF